MHLPVILAAASLPLLCSGQLIVPQQDRSTTSTVGSGPGSTSTNEGSALAAAIAKALGTTPEVVGSPYIAAAIQPSPSATADAVGIQIAPGRLAPSPNITYTPPGHDRTGLSTANATPSSGVQTTVGEYDGVYGPPASVQPASGGSSPGAGSVPTPAAPVADQETGWQAILDTYNAGEASQPDETGWKAIMDKYGPGPSPAAATGRLRSSASPASPASPAVGEDRAPPSDLLTAWRKWLGMEGEPKTTPVAVPASVPLSPEARASLTRGQLLQHDVPPGVCGRPDESSWAGYFNIDPDKDKNYFYWAFPPRNPPSKGYSPSNSIHASQQPQQQSPEKTVLWLTGGPGCSSMLALATENGPCRIDGSGMTVNEHAWNANATVIWVDQPSDVGYSYSADITGRDHNEEEVARDMYRFLQALWKSDMPRVKGSQLFIAAESYGGHYAPALAKVITDANAVLRARGTGPAGPKTGPTPATPPSSATDPGALFQQSNEASMDDTKAGPGALFQLANARGQEKEDSVASYGTEEAWTGAAKPAAPGRGLTHTTFVPPTACWRTATNATLCTSDPAFANVTGPNVTYSVALNGTWPGVAPTPSASPSAAETEPLTMPATVPQPPSSVASSLPKWMFEDDVQLDLAGVAIGNGLTRPDVQYQYYAQQGSDYASKVLGHPVLTPDQVASMDKAWPTCKAAIEACQSVDALCAPAQILCNWAMIRPYQESGLSPYDMRKKCEHPPLCFDAQPVTDFFNSPSTRSALGVPAKVQAWQACNLEVNLDFASDWMKRFDSHLVPVLGNGTRVLVYAGDMDFICNHLGNEAWTLGLDWPGASAFQAAPLTPWSVDGGDAGEARSCQNLTFLRLWNGGHMVPGDLPGPALAMLQQHLFDQPFGTC